MMFPAKKEKYGDEATKSETKEKYDNTASEKISINMKRPIVPCIVCDV